ncbi:hypothetical protein O7634_24605 [Micromonospora sp. WMMD1120]|uniref:hypothetical protein n=1 Tax=Micromonospora sp. WMMD1120 TaxID=3016106 RepID=UPI0024161411|nr:hypothetical protein [Micromonospora sp. WMMD1120]MDG4809945.1 hypothetical protein [Micromonospora sp. WMMD1120]
MKRWQYRVEIYAGPTLGWVNITADVRGSLSITRGRSGEGYRADPGKCGFRLDNRTGRYSPRNPLSDLYGLIGKNTLVRVSAGPIGGSLVGRFFGEIPSWPPRWSLSGADRYVDLDAAGLLRRFRQGDQPVLSPMRRTIEGSNPVAYWPGEDGELSGQAGAATSGLSPLVASGSVEFKPVENYTFAASSTVFGTTALADLAAGGKLSARLSADATAATAGGPWTVHTAILVDNLGTLSGDVVLLEWTTNGGTYTRWQIKVTTTARTQLVGITSAGASTLLIDHPSASPTFHHFAGSASVSGGTVTARLQTSNGVNLTTTFAGSLGGVTSVTVNATGVTSSSPMPAGHVAVWVAAPIPVAIVGATDSYGTFVRESRRSNLGEAAVDRLIRLAAEIGLDLDAAPADPGHVSRMNVQLAASTTSAIDDAIAVDGGLLYESRDSGALAYRTRSELYNQTPVAIAYAGQTGEPFDPVDDADDVRNSITVERRDGSSARAVQLTGPLAAAVPPDGVGIYTTSETLNLLDDGELGDQAGHRLRLGTVDEPRYPAITVQLSAPDWVAAPTLRAQLLALDVGGVLEVAGPPVWVSGRVRTLVTGYTETIDEFLWSITFNGPPASPWDVAEAGGPQRAAGEGSTLAANLTSTGTVVTLSNTVANGPWTWDPTDYPLDVRVGGEQVRADAPGTVLNPTTAWFETSTAGYVAAGSTLTWQAAGRPGTPHGAARVNPDGVTAVGGIYSPAIAATAGTAYRITGWVRADTATVQISMAVDWQTSGGVYISTSFGTVTALPVGVWTPLVLVATAPATTGLAVPRGRHQGTPAASATWRISEFTLVADSTATGSGAFQRLSCSASGRGVNGSQRAWPTGTDVNVWLPAVAAL